MIQDGFCLHEEGITATVQTIFSQYRLIDVIDQILLRKWTAVETWLETIKSRPKNCLICGAYLSGAHIANALSRKTSVTVVDRYPHMRQMLDPKISFFTSSNGFKISSNSQVAIRS